MIESLKEGLFLVEDQRVLNDPKRQHTPLAWVSFHEGALLVKNLNWCRGETYVTPDSDAGWSQAGGVLTSPVTPEGITHGVGAIKFTRATQSALSSVEIDAAVNGVVDLLVDAGFSPDEADALLSDPSREDELLDAGRQLCYGAPY